MELSNNTRIWENNGHTPQEIFEKFEKCVWQDNFSAFGT